MFTNTKCSIYAGQDKVYTESVCLSTDVKPTTGIANGSTCIEMNTGKKFMFNEDSGEWVEVPSSGGGGGGGGGDGDFSVANMTLDAGSGFLPSIKIGVIYVDEEFDALLFNSQDLGKPSGTYIVPLYKGKALASVDLENNYTISGNASVDEEGIITITGDFTVSKN